MSGVFYQDDRVTVHHGDALDVLGSLPAQSVDAVVTDPPYGLEFMGRDWDGADGFRRSLNPADAGRDSVFGRSSRTGPEYRAGTVFQQWCEAWATECLRVLKPGGHLLAFGGTRTAHRLVCAVEDAGFEVRDSIAWLYGSGFPKSRNLTGEWEGWGTALKPSHEPIVVARRPLRGPVAANVAEHGTGALNIAGCRVGDRWPTNGAMDPHIAAALDEQSGVLTSGANPTRRSADKFRDAYGDFRGQEECIPVRGADSGGASRFFPVFRYEAKAGADERPRVDGMAHPTVKPLGLMRWLVRLVTPSGGLVLDPFAGSGTTAEACVLEGFRCIAVEREPTYLPLIRARLARPMQPVLDLTEGTP